MKSKSSRGGAADAPVSCRWSISWFLKPVGLALLVAFTAVRVLAQPERVILLRHGEKPLDDNKSSLSPRGQERAKALVSFFTQTPGLLDQGAKPVLFATHFGRKVHANHTHETLAPLAQELHVRVEAPYENTAYAALAKHILTSLECRGKVVIVCWDHEHLADLAHALGVKPEPPKWKAGVFDRIWLLTPKDGQMTLQNRPQRLLPGDSKP